ncbi:CreA family protein [soil metagenome]
MIRLAFALLLIAASVLTAAAQEADDPELIFKKTTVWRILSPDAKLATYAIDDPIVQGVACHFTVPEVGGWTGWVGFAEERSETSLSCRQIGAVTFTGKFEQGAEVYSQRRSFFFKKMHIVRGCDAKRNTLVYLNYTDKLIEGSPQNSTSTVPIAPWGTLPAPKCGDFLE